MSESRTTQILENILAEAPGYIAKGEKSGAEPFLIVGYNPALTTSLVDIWSAGGAYVFPTAAAQWRIAAGNAGDVGTVIKGNAEGANQTIKCDAGGSETILLDANVDFSAATAVAVGDIVLLDPKGTSPEFGYVTDITDAATGKLIIGNGFSEGGSCATARAYTIVDKSGSAGAQVLEIYYLTDTFISKKVLVALAGASAVDFKGSGGAALTNTYRLNEMRVVSVGSGGVPVAAIQCQLQAGPNTVYGNIALGYNIARSSAFTVPADKRLVITDISFGAVTNNDTKVQAARMMLRSTMEDYSGFITNGIFYPFAESLVSNSFTMISPKVPMVFYSGADLKVSVIGLTGFSGPAACVLRGWLEDDL